MRFAGARFARGGRAGIAVVVVVSTFTRVVVEVGDVVVLSLRLRVVRVVGTLE